MYILFLTDGPPAFSLDGATLAGATYAEAVFAGATLAGTEKRI